MPRNIVLCSDGTGNSGGKARGTNVWKTYLAVDRHDHVRDPGLIPQVAFYDDGVGTSQFRPLAVAGGAGGVGLGRNIRELYTSLARTYAPGDHLYLFGFSRGAYTIRSLAGMIAEVGVIDGRALAAPSLLPRLVARAYRAYRAAHRGSRSASPPPSPKVAAFKAGLRREQVGLHEPEIEFIGVWDTVDAVGVPVDGLRDLLGWLAIGRRPHVTRLTPRIRHACHALAIDDERRTFSPVMWHQADSPGTRLEQVWFAGVHSNVGGGYPKEGLATVSLHWMMHKARERARAGGGLRFVSSAIAAAHDGANAHSMLYDSRAGLGSYYRYRVRELDVLCAGGVPDIHVTAIDRISQITDDYAPTNLPERMRVVTTDPGQEVLARASDYQQRLEASAVERRDLLPALHAIRRSRRHIYDVFLGLTVTVAAMLGVYGAAWQPGIVALEATARLLRPALGWLNPLVVPLVEYAGGILSAVGGVTLPVMLEPPVAELVNVPELVTLVMLAAAGLVAWRYVLVARMRRIGVDMWAKALAGRPAPSALAR